VCVCDIGPCVFAKHVDKLKILLILPGKLEPWFYAFDVHYNQLFVSLASRQSIALKRKLLQEKRPFGAIGSIILRLALRTKCLWHI